MSRIGLELEFGSNPDGIEQCSVLFSRIFYRQARTSTCRNPLSARSYWFRGRLKLIPTSTNILPTRTMTAKTSSRNPPKMPQRWMPIVKTTCLKVWHWIRRLCKCSTSRSCWLTLCCLRLLTVLEKVSLTRKLMGFLSSSTNKSQQEAKKSKITEEQGCVSEDFGENLYIAIVCVGYPDLPSFWADSDANQEGEVTIGVVTNRKTGLHRFEPVRFSKSTKCTDCKKKIWTKSGESSLCRNYLSVLCCRKVGWAKLSDRQLLAERNLRFE